MTLERFFEKFEQFADAPDELIAVCDRLEPQAGLPPSRCALRRTRKTRLYGRELESINLCGSVPNLWLHLISGRD
jgi:hypothetical protein